MPRISKKEMTEFGVKLDALLKRANLSDNQFAKKMKISQPNVHALKYLTDKPRKDTLKRLADFFRVDISYFFPSPIDDELSKGKDDIKVYLLVENKGKVAKKIRIG